MTLYVKDFRKCSSVTLNVILGKNEVLDKFQSGFRVAHRTESALLSVVNDLCIIRDSGNPAALILFDWSAVIDTIYPVNLMWLGSMGWF